MKTTFEKLRPRAVTLGTGAKMAMKYLGHNLFETLTSDAMRCNASGM